MGLLLVLSALVLQSYFSGHNGELRCPPIPRFHHRTPPLIAAIAAACSMTTLTQRLSAINLRLNGMKNLEKAWRSNCRSQTG